MTSREDLLQAKRVLSAIWLPTLHTNDDLMAMSLHQSATPKSMSKNVHGVGIGRKYVAGRSTNELCIRFHVEKKLPEWKLDTGSRLPASVDGILTDVVEAPTALGFPVGSMKSEIYSASDDKAFVTDRSGQKTPACSSRRRTRIRPLVSGVSTSSIDKDAGTIGYFVRSTREGDNPNSPYILSNMHVFASKRNPKFGDPLFQPGQLDGCAPQDNIAELSRFEPPTFNGNTSYFVDAAIGRLHADVLFDPIICSIGRVFGTINAEEGMFVRKHGRTTGYTEGVVTDVAYDSHVMMDRTKPQKRSHFLDQIRIEPVAPYRSFGIAGDSGSLVVTLNEALAVGLFFAASETGGYGVANPIQDVLKLLEIQLY